MQQWYILGPYFVSEPLELQIDEEEILQSLGNISPADCVIELVELDPIDLQDLEDSGPSSSMATVQHMKSYHHLIALKLATGSKAIEICAQLRLTPQTITRLQKTPQFQELVEGYRTEVVDQHMDQISLMEVVNGEAISAIHERLLGPEREAIPLTTLRQLVETFADRTGHSPIRKSQSLNVTARAELSKEDIEAIREIHSEEVRYIAPGNEQAGAVTVSAESSEDQRPTRSIAEILKSTQKDEIDIGPSEGPGV